MRRIITSLIFFWSAARAEFTIAGPFAARDGETCVVCNSRLSSNDVAFVIDGQRLPVMKGMEHEVLSNPGQYVKKARPEGMMFSGQAQGGMPAPYFWAGLFVLTGLVFGGFCAHTAMTKGYSAGQWFALGFFFSVAAQLALLSKPALSSAGPVPPDWTKMPVTASPVVCGSCGAGNHPSAAACLRCGKAMH